MAHRNSTLVGLTFCCHMRSHSYHEPQRIGWGRRRSRQLVGDSACRSSLGLSVRTPKFRLVCSARRKGSRSGIGAPYPRLKRSIPYRYGRQAAHRPGSGPSRNVGPITEAMPGLVPGRMRVLFGHISVGGNGLAGGWSLPDGKARFLSLSLGLRPGMDGRIRTQRSPDFIGRVVAPKSTGRLG